MLLQQKRQEELLLKIFDRTEHRDDSFAFSQSTIWNAIETFNYQLELEGKFDAFYQRYEDLFIVDCQEWSNTKKVSLLLRKLGTTELSKFVDYILPKKTSELKFSEAVKFLSKLFSPNSTLFHRRWKCLNLQKSDDDDYLTFASVVNKHCNDFRLSDLSADDFKCLIFVQGLVSSKNDDMFSPDLRMNRVSSSKSWPRIFNR